MDTSTSPNHNYAVINTNEQETRDPFLSNTDPHFTPSANKTPSSELLTELLAIHKKRSCKKIIYVGVFFCVIVIIGLVLIGVTYILPKCNSSDSGCEINRTIWRLTGSVVVGVAAFSGLIVYCILSCLIGEELDGFKQHTGEDQRTIWQLTGAEWSYFLNYIYGPDRQWREEPCAPLFCCRRASYERLNNRQYGHIILDKNGFIIDELYLISFQSNPLIRTEVVDVGGDPLNRLLRMHIVFMNGRYRSNIYFDLLVPSSVTQEQLQVLVQYYNTKTA